MLDTMPEVMIPCHSMNIEQELPLD